ncbi:MAG: hypothetical protein MJZ74_02200 [Muribaculaceae bacterium]|nr:hypothetical protein [Muribaculaceae bacterium]
MKSIIVFFMTLCLVAPMARAQDREVQMPANEAGVSWGVMPAPLWLNVFETVFSLGKASFKNDTQAISAHYMRNLNKTFAVGGDVTFQHQWGASEGRNVQSATYVTVMPSARARWFNRKRVSVYSRLAVGACVCMPKGKEEENDVFFAFQASPVGVDFGSEKVRGFVEVGAGFQGFVLAGVKVGF